MTEREVAEKHAEELKEAGVINVPERKMGCQNSYQPTPPATLSGEANQSKSATTPNVGEIRVTDPITGGQKGMKDARFSLIPSSFLWELAEHYGKGAKKYEDRNWERGYKWSLSLDASMRHLHQFLAGERWDAETQSHHLIAAIWHLIALHHFDHYGLGTDDIVRILPAPKDIL